MSQFFTSGNQSIGSFSFSISPSKDYSSEYSGLISFRIDWFDLLEVQGTLKSLLQNQISKSTNSSALSLPHSPTFTSIHDYWKNHTFDYTDFLGKVMSLLFNMLSRFVIAFFPRLGLVLINLYPHRFITVSASTHPAPEP